MVRNILFLIILIAAYFLPQANADNSKLIWLQIKHAAKYDISEVEWDGRQFIAIEDGNTILTSPDGIQWESRNFNLFYSYRSLTSGNQFTIATLRNTIFRYDGQECWAEVAHVEEELGTTAWDGESFFVATESGVMQSKNGEHWSKESIGSISGIPSLTFGDKKLIAQDEKSAQIRTQTTPWQSLLENPRVTNITPWKNELWALSQANSWVFLYRNNKWKRVLNPPGWFSSTHQLVATKDYLFAMGSHFSWSTDGFKWKSKRFQDSVGWLNDVAQGKERLVAVGNDGTILLGVPKEKANDINKLVVNGNQQRAKELETPSYIPRGYHSSHKQKSLLTNDSNVKDVKIKRDLTSAEEIIQHYIELTNTIDTPLAPLLNNIRKEYPDEPETSLAFSFMLEHGFILWFDAEFGFYPVGYDSLIANMAYLAKQQGVKIEDVKMTLAEDSCTKQEQYQLAWKIDKHQYGINFVDNSDWFKPDVFDAINVSLKEAGYSQRFISLDTGDQTAMLIFVDPAAIGDFMQHYFQY